jgi:hypothetical protein
MSGTEEALRSVAKVADWIIGGTIVLCTATLLYCVFYYSWMHPRSFTGLVGPLLYYVLPATLAGLLCVSLRLRPSYRINLSVLLVSIGISLCTTEQVLALYGRKGGEVQIAKKFGVNFDDRSTLLTLTDFLEGEVIEGLTAAVGEAILSPQLGRVCNLPLASRLKRMTPCSASYGFPPRLTSFFSP